MDELTSAAITAVWHSDIEQARRWFVTIGAEYRALVDSGDETDWQRFKDSLRSRAERDLLDVGSVDGFFAYLDTHCPSPMAIIKQLAEPEHLDELVSRYAHAVEQGHIGL